MSSQPVVVLPESVNRSRSIVQQGVLTRLRWADPHTALIIHVIGPDRTTVAWVLEFESVAALVRHGLQSADVRLGEQVLASGFRLGTEGEAAIASSVTFLDGRIFYAAGPSFRAGARNGHPLVKFSCRPSRHPA